MSTPEDQAPLDAAADDASPQSGKARVDDESGHDNDVQQASVDPTEPPQDPRDSLSPAVRRLVRQFDLDVTGIHGTGPSGRIRVGDVMNLLGGRTDTGKRDAPPRSVPGGDDVEPGDDAELDDDPELADAQLTTKAAAREPPTPAATGASARAAAPISTVFDCDLGRVLAHRKRLRDENVELLTTSYFLTALASALDAVPEITAGQPPRFGVHVTRADGALRSALLDVATVDWDAALDERERAVDAAVRAHLGVDVAGANLLVHHYGEIGCLLATPAPLGEGHAASIGIGRVRREVVVRTIDGTETPRLATRCYLTLTFFADLVPLHHANRALADAVRTLEGWPD